MPVMKEAISARYTRLRSGIEKGDWQSEKIAWNFYSCPAYFPLLNKIRGGNSGTTAA